MKFELSDLIVTAHDNGIYVQRAGTNSWEDSVLVGNANQGLSVTEIIELAEQLLD